MLNPIVHMGKLFVPYKGKKPSVVVVKGHPLLILARDAQMAEEVLPVVGADTVRRVYTGQDQEDETVVLSRLAKKNRCGVMIAPSELAMPDLMKNLENQLPWLQ